MNIPGELLLVIMTVFTASGQLLIKRGTAGLSWGRSIKAFFVSLKNPFIISGLFLALAAPLLYIRALGTIPLSKAFMFNSLSHVFVFLAGKFILGEKAGFLHWLGISLIAAGFILPGFFGGIA